MVLPRDLDSLTVRLQPGERLNRDFILRFALAEQAAGSILSYSTADGARPGTFALSIVPPSQLDRPAQPRDIVFVLDRSGSMSGWKMVAARRAVGRLLDTLLEHDRFSVLAFDNEVEFSPKTPRQLVAASNRARWRTIEWLGKIDAAVAEVAAALAALKSRGRFSPRRRRVQDLIDRLESLASLMDREQHVRRSDVNDLVVRGRELLAAASRRGQSSAAALDEFVAKVQTLVDELGQSPTAVRNEFLEIIAAIARA